MPYVTLVPSTTLAVVRLQPLGGFRDLAVKIDLRGNVAPGYLTTNVTVDPQVVTVFGSSAALEAVPGFISTEPVSVTDATGDISNRVRLVLPPGVSYLGDPTVQVDVKIKPIESSVTMMSPLNPQGLSPELSARFSPETLDVILSGPIARLNALQSSGVQSFVNLFSLSEGTYQITPTVSRAQRHQRRQRFALDHSSDHRPVRHTDDHGHTHYHQPLAHADAKKK